jgi:beta-aspartyl-peptidase (threonine type)
MMERNSNLLKLQNDRFYGRRRNAWLDGFGQQEGEMLARLRHMILTTLSLVFAVLVTPAAAASPAGYTYYKIGNVSASTPGRTETALMLMGGGGWDHQAFRWFIAKAGGGHIVVLRASGGADAGEEIYAKIGGATSVQTLVFDDRKASSNPTVRGILARADGIFIAGGDQSNYVRFWKGTPVQQALNDHVARGRPIAGTSAGLAILGGAAYGAMDGGSIDSMTALSDPLGPAVTIVRDFLRVPFLTHAVTDTHFTARDRLGRLIAFVAQVHASGDPLSVGLGIDEASALCVDARGIGRLYSADKKGYAWLVEPRGQPKLTSGQPLNYRAVRVTGLGVDGQIDLKTMRITKPAFAGTVTVKTGRLYGVPTPPGASWSLAIHGGAGVIVRGNLTPAVESAYRKSLNDALLVGAAALKSGRSSLDAVEAVVRVLEDNPLFNAGKGAVFDARGINLLDAAIMDGATLKAGSVAGVTRTKNPVTLARKVMEQTRHVLLVGTGADEFARASGVEQVDPSYFRTEKRWQEYLSWRRNPQAALPPTYRYGTVGAVALDVRGHLAAATSTGGVTGKRWGRVGDSPIIGAGTYAADGVCAVSTTGTGEYFIRTSAARQVCDRISWNKQSVQSSADATIEDIESISGDGGLIAMDGHGDIAFAMNTEGMYRGSISSIAPARIQIYADEKRPSP